jgi:tubby-related protein 1
LCLSEAPNSGKFLLAAKKRTGNATSNYIISTDSEKMEKSAAGYLGKVRSNFLGTEFYIFDTGANPKNSKSEDECRC